MNADRPPVQGKYLDMLQRLEAAENLKLLTRLAAAEAAERDARAHLHRLEIQNIELMDRLERAMDALRGGTA